MKDVVVIGVAGGTGSGKSTLVKRLQEAFKNDDVATICHDFYYKAHPELTYEERTKLNYDHPDAFDTWLMVEHIKALKAGKAVECPTYSFVEHNRAEETMPVKPSKVIIVDGILINKNDENGFDEDEDPKKLSLAALVCGIALESETFLEDSHHDRLTGLKNRMGFYYDFGKRFREYLIPESGKIMSVFICDIDRFKRVNDTYGHNAGDDVLIFSSQLLESFCGENDSVYRWGGEEFVMVMRDTDLIGAAKKAEDIRIKLMESDIEADGNTIKCTMSFGCSLFDPTKSIEENISNADERLYTAKETGRNKVCCE